MPRPHIVPLTILAGCLLSVGLAAGQNRPSPEQALFLSMEERLTRNKSVRMEVDMAIPTEIIEIKARLSASGPKKLRLNFDVSAGGVTERITTISDGVRMHANIFILNLNKEEWSAKRATPERLCAMALATTARAGLAGDFWLGKTSQVMEVKDLDLDRDLPVSDFRRLRNEIVAGTPTRVIKYKLTPPGKTLAEGARITVWIDPETKLPLKRVTRIDPDGGTDPQRLTTITENYRRIVFDEAIADAEFVLSK